MPTSIKRKLFLLISVLCLVTMGGGGYLYARTGSEPRLRF